jgi:hypothetical protein
MARWGMAVKKPGSVLSGTWGQPMHYAHISAVEGVASASKPSVQV